MKTLIYCALSVCLILPMACNKNNSADSKEMAEDENKEKIIGKEGKSIKAFERMTGVEVIVDDTTGSITLFSFVPVHNKLRQAHV